MGLGDWRGRSVAELLTPTVSVYPECIDCLARTLTVCP
jgi:hypothetical protein